jgi:hypothetical protein
MEHHLKTAYRSSDPHYSPQEDYYHYQPHVAPAPPVPQPECAEDVVWTVSSYKQDGRGILMADILRMIVYHLGYGVNPTYQCEMWTHYWFEPHWEVTAIIYERVLHYRSKEISRHNDVAARDTMEAGIAEAARRTLYVLSHRERLELTHTRSLYTPYIESGNAKTYIASASGHSPTSDNLRELLAVVNTTLDDTNNMLPKAQWKKCTLEAQKRLLEATLNGDDRPVIRDGVVEPHLSPAPKRPRYNSPDTHTRAFP